MLSHPAVRLHELLVGCSTAFNNVLGHQLLHSLIQLNVGLFEGVTFDISVRSVLSPGRFFLAVSSPGCL